MAHAPRRGRSSGVGVPILVPTAPPISALDLLVNAAAAEEPRRASAGASPSLSQTKVDGAVAGVNSSSATVPQLAPQRPLSRSEAPTRVATPSLNKPVPSGPFGPLTAGPSVMGRSSGTSPYQPEPSSALSELSDSSTEELMDVDAEIENEEGREEKHVELQAELEAERPEVFAIGIAEGRKQRKRSNTTETSRATTESRSPQSPRAIPLHKAPLKPPPPALAAKKAAPRPMIAEVLVPLRRARKSFPAEQSSGNSSGSDDEPLLVKMKRDSSATSSSSSAQVSKRLLEEGDAAVSKRAKAGDEVPTIFPQNAACEHPSFAEAPSCAQCSDNVPSKCTYKGRRAFMARIDNKGHARPDPRAPFYPAVDDNDRSSQDPDFPTRYREPFTQTYAKEIKTAVAHALKSAIAVEEAHSARPGCFEISIPVAERSVCDGCLTTIFLGSWFCSCCRTELCLDCGTELEQIHRRGGDRSNPKQAQRLQLCGRALHGGPDLGKDTEFVPQSKLSQAELTRIKDEMARRRQDHPVEVPAPLDQDVLDYVYSLKGGYHSSDEASHRVIHLGPGILDEEPPASAPRPSPRLPPPTSTEGVVAKLASMDRQALFASLWSRGEPMLVDIALTRHLERQWSPQRFVQEFGDQSCTIGSNTGHAERRGVTVRDYFELVAVPEQSFKIKDYPPASTFKEQLPALYEDFISAVPFPEITCPHGPRNLAAHAPLNSTPPDLGPKGYWSQTSNDLVNGKGSTVLHMDLADAVNLMLWSADMPDGSPGLAAWDIFRAEDSNKIRDFVYELRAAQHGEKDIERWRSMNDDPIHVQETFLNSALRAQLLEKKGVKSFRIWQRPGQVVFIPAGCAHQVCNFSDCIKVASDFVSKENVQRCWTVTDEFRRITKGEDLWREDVLQLKSQLLWAWRSCERFDKHRVESRPE